jgi:hypothetical protein
MSQGLEQGLVRCRSGDHERPVVWEISPRHPDNGVEHPACRRVLETLTVLVRHGGLRRLEGGAKPLRQGGIPPQAAGHHPQQGHDACRLFEIPRGGQALWGVQDATPAFGVGVAVVAGAEVLRGEAGVVEGLGGKDAPTGVVDGGLPGSEPPGARAFERIPERVRWRAVAGAPPFGRAGDGPDGALGHDGGLQARCKGGEGLPGLGFAGKRRAAPRHEGVDCLRAVLQERFVHRARRLRLARRGVEEPPAVRDATIARAHHVLARARHERGHRLRIGWGPDRVGFAHGRRDTGAPMRLRIGTLLAVLGTLEGPVGDTTRCARGELQRRHRGGAEVATVRPVTTLPTAGRQQHGNAGLVGDQQLQHAVVAVWALSPTVAAGDVHAVRLRLRVTVVAPRNMQPGALALRHAGGPSQPRRSGRGHAAVAGRPPNGRKGLQGPAAGVIGQRRGGPRGDMRPEVGLFWKTRGPRERAWVLHPRPWSPLALTASPTVRARLSGWWWGA